MKKIILFGAGKIGGVYIEKNGERLESNLLFCDNDEKKAGYDVNGIKIISFSEMINLYKGENIEKIIVTMESDECINQCITNGIKWEDMYFYVPEDNKIIPIDCKWSKVVFSLDGEELYLRKKFANKKAGVYVDVGANHPFRFSNTWWAYKKGWKGINIEPDRRNYELLSAIRKNDININCGVSDRETVLNYYAFNESALNSFCYDKIINKEDIKEIEKIPVNRMDAILEKYNIREIDFMDIDVEGMELEVLRSINWEKVSIECLLVEQLGVSLLEIIESEVYMFLRDKGYTPINKFGWTVIYEKSIF
ncbi:MAG: FkbM family methyltransferase [Lachnospiraceae bacterium]|nr:FkbM family methyltransferase [Lachnospiraceae bacterium]